MTPPLGVTTDFFVVKEFDPKSGNRLRSLPNLARVYQLNNLSFFFLSEFSFTNIHDSQGSRERERVSI